MPTYIRYEVWLPGQSLLNAQHTPRYFRENQRKDAEAYAKQVGGTLLDTWAGQPSPWPVSLKARVLV